MPPGCTPNIIKALGWPSGPRTVLSVENGRAKLKQAEAKPDDNAPEGRFVPFFRDGSPV